MLKLNYNKLTHRNETQNRGYSVRNSFYMQKGNGNADAYWGAYKGDFSVFMSTWQTIDRVAGSQDVEK